MHDIGARFCQTFVPSSASLHPDFEHVLEAHFKERVQLLIDKIASQDVMLYDIHTSTKKFVLDLKQIQGRKILSLIRNEIRYRLIHPILEIDFGMKNLSLICHIIIFYL